jgi:hypothetical protein
MWYLGIDADANVTSAEAKVLTDLGFYLANSGWSLRCGGRGVVDDLLLKGAIKSSLHGCDASEEPPHEIILPFSHYRQYNDRQPHVINFSGLDQQKINRAVAQGELNCRQLKIDSPTKRSLLGSAMCLASGINDTDDEQAKFALTLVRHQNKGEVDPLLYSSHAPLFRLLKSKGIPIFNLFEPSHLNRILGFLQQKQANRLAS